MTAATASANGELEVPPAERGRTRTTSAVDREAAIAFLRARFGDVEDGYFTVDHAEGGRWVAEGFHVRQLDAAADRIVALACGSDTYVSQNLVEAPPSPGGRVKGADVIAVPGLYAEVDTPQPYKKNGKRYPPPEVVLEAVKGLPCGYSLLLSSGGGFHVHALFGKPFLVETDEDRARVSKVLVGWQRYMLRQLAQAGSYDLDTTADLARVLRVPGTLNHRSGSPVPVTLLDETEVRIDFDEVEGLLCDVGLLDDRQEHVATIALLPILEKGAGLPDEIAAKVAALCRREQRFRKSWGREERSDLKDQSRSGHDQSMASFMAQAGFTEEEIYRVLVAWRHEHGDHDIPKRDYYGRTIGKAMTGAQPRPPTASQVLETARILKEDPTGEELDRFLRLAAQAVPGLDDIARQLLKKDLVKVLHDRKVKGAASLVDAALRVGESQVDADVVSFPRRAKTAADSPYRIIDGCTYQIKKLRDGAELPVLLASFEATITEERVVDDGAERNRVFMLGGRLPAGELLPSAAVSTAGFQGMGWVTSAWGNRAVVAAGQATRDHLRAAIQVLSGSVPTREVYAHTGWRQIGGRWVYLTAGACIGAGGAVDGVEINLPSALTSYLLPPPATGAELVRSIRASLALLDLAPLRVTVPLLASIMRAPLAEVEAVELAVFVAGATGLGKTSIVTVFLSHFGAFDLRHVPAGFHSTGNSLERLAFQAKDVAFLVDDFNPTGDRNDQSRFHRDAERLFRGAANRTGRQRMGSDGSLRPTYIPRGLVVATGEDLPRGESLRARVLVAELEPGDVDFGRLTEAQDRSAGVLYAQAMAGYVQWLAPRLDDLRRCSRTRIEQLRTDATPSATHRRTPEAVASLAWGLETYLDFAVDAGAAARNEADEICDKCWNALRDVAASQAAHLAAADPVVRFLDLLRGLFVSGRAHLLDASNGASPRMATSWGWVAREEGGGDNVHRVLRPQGVCLGWVEVADADPVLYLDPEALFAEVSDLARAQGEPLTVSPRTMWKRMWEAGHVGSRERSQANYTIRKRGLGGDKARRRVLHIVNVSHGSGPTGPEGWDCDAGLPPGGTTPVSQWPHMSSRQGASGTSGANCSEPGTTCRTDPTAPGAGVVPAERPRDPHPGPLGPLGPLPERGEQSIEADQEEEPPW